MVEKSISPEVGSHRYHDAYFKASTHGDYMRFSTGGASRTQSFTSTISPPQKSSNSSVEKKYFSPHGRVILASRPGTKTKMNNNVDD